MADLGLILIGWVLAAAAFIGLGGLFLSSLGFGFDPRELRLQDCFWVGVVCVVGFLQLWNLALPVNGWTWLVFGPASGLGWARLSRDRNVGRDSGAVLLVGVGLAAAVAYLALGPPGNGDDGLYHTQSLRWVTQFPVVPGLANLNLRVGYNHAYFLLAALLDVGPLFHQAQHVTNGLLFLAVALPLLASVEEAFLGRGPLLSSNILATVIVGLTVEQCLGPNLTTVAADGCTWAILCETSLLTLGPLLDGQPVERPRAALVVLICALGLVTKIPGGVLTLPMAALAVGSALRGSGSEGVARLAWRTLGACVGLIIPWCIRGAIISGYPLFPFAGLRLSLPWTLPRARAAAEQAYVVAFARYQLAGHDTSLLSLAWIPGWLEREWLDNRAFLFPSLTLALGLALLAAGWLRGQRPRSALALAPALASILLWFATVPDPRFAGPLLWIGATTAMLVGLQTVAWDSPRTHRAVLGCLAGAFCLSVVALVPGRWVHLAGFESGPPERLSLLTLPSGDQVHLTQGECRELPCADNDDFHFRVPGDLGAGFAPNHPD